MRKSISALVLAVIISTIASTYFVGVMAQKEINKVFIIPFEKGFSSKLVSYDKHFFSATAVSEFTLFLDNEVPVTLQFTSHIKHYPYKAKIETELHLLDPSLEKQAQQYFANSSWLTSAEEITLFGDLSGKLNLLAGSYHKGQESIATEGLTIEYSLNLEDDSGSALINWGGGNAIVQDRDYKIDALQLSSDFSRNNKSINQYSYLMTISSIFLQQDGFKIKWQGVDLKGSNLQSLKQDRVDIRSDWKVAQYQFGTIDQKVFTDNHIKFDLNSLHIPSINNLASQAQSVAEVEKALSELLSNGAHISLSTLTSQTPWGKLDASMNFTLERGASFREMLDNPFTLMDYLDGNGKVALPKRLLAEPVVSEPLQIGVMTGFLVSDGPSLLFETQLEQGELMVNGKIIPL